MEKTGTYLTRYGYSDNIVESNFEEVVNDLLEELRTEESDEPDDEHTQVSISNEIWGVTAQVSGLITFDNMDFSEEKENVLPETMFLRNISDQDLKSIWHSVLTDDREKLLSFSWVQFEELSEYKYDYYRTDN